MMGRTGKNSKWTIIIRISKNAPGLQEQLAVPGANGLLDLHRMETGNGKRFPDSLDQVQMTGV